MIVKEVYKKSEKKVISERILKVLPEWFGVKESINKYINESSKLPFFVAIDEDSNPLGFISIKENNQHTIEIYVMGVLPKYHNQSIGTQLFNKVLEWANKKGYEFIQVKTLDYSHPDIFYKKTRAFYKSVGFKQLECFPEIWGPDNPCLIMIRHLK